MYSRKRTKPNQTYTMTSQWFFTREKENEMHLLL